jgi:hypothetical protein
LKCDHIINFHKIPEKGKLSPSKVAGNQLPLEFSGFLEDEVSSSCPPDALVQQIDDQHQCLGPSGNGIKRNTGPSCHNVKVMPFSPLIFSTLNRIFWIPGEQIINISAP